MFDTRMIGVPNRPQKGAIVVDLPQNWPSGEVAQCRQADIGHRVLTYVTVVSAAEAAAINARYKAKAEETLRTNLAEKGPDYIGSNMDAIAVEDAVRVEEMLEAIKQEGYFASWVIIEECTID